MGNAGKSPSPAVGEGWGLGAVVPAATSEVGSAGVGRGSGEALHAAIRAAIAAITARDADERLALVLVMGTGALMAAEGSTDRYLESGPAYLEPSP